VSASVRVVAEVDGNEVEVSTGNPLTNLSMDLGRYQLAELLEVAVGQIARAHRLDYVIEVKVPERSTT
jgi:hypothetical protein